MVIFIISTPPSVHIFKAVVTMPKQLELILLRFYMGHLSSYTWKPSGWKGRCLQPWQWLGPRVAEVTNEITSLLCLSVPGYWMVSNLFSPQSHCQPSPGLYLGEALVGRKRNKRRENRKAGEGREGFDLDSKRQREENREPHVLQHRI